MYCVLCLSFGRKLMHEFATSLKIIRALIGVSNVLHKVPIIF